MQKLLHSTVSLINLNALLQIYEVQPGEIINSQTMVTHPKFNSLLQLPYFSSTLFTLIGLYFLKIDKQQQIKLIAAEAIVMAQLIMFQIPKTLNMILIYCLAIQFFYQLYQSMKDWKIPEQPIKVVRIPEKVEKMTKTTQKKKPKRKAQVQNQEEVIQEIETVSLEAKKSDIVDRETDIDTLNFEINNDNISISESRLQFEIKTGDQIYNINCNFDTFDSAFTALETQYQPNDIVEIKQHVLLNLYDEYSDPCCKLWALQRLLQF
ncbi:hypothetical protein pb186bvf_005448 [Paramecium bursaria]